MNDANVAAPIRKTVRVEATPEHAFEVFTRRIGRWWPPDYGLLSRPRHELILEPGIDGRWYERAADGAELTWGKVLVWEPPQRLVLAWQIDGTFQYRPDFHVEVEVRFVPDGPGATRVELEHRDIERYGEYADPMRTALESPNGWSRMLAGFAAEIERAA